MKKETRIYGVDFDVFDFSEISPQELTDEEFIAEAEKQGNVWTLPYFLAWLNEMEVVNLTFRSYDIPYYGE